MKPDLLPDIPFQLGHTGIKCRSIQSEVRGLLRRILGCEWVASSAVLSSMAGDLQFVGDTVKSADHRTIWIEDAPPFNAQGAQVADGIPGRDPLRPAQDPSSLDLPEGIKALKKIEIFDDGVIVKRGAATIVLASPAVEIVVVCHFLVCLLHPVIEIFHAAYIGHEIPKEHFESIGLDAVPPWKSSLPQTFADNGRPISALVPFEQV